MSNIVFKMIYINTLSLILISCLIPVVAIGDNNSSNSTTYKVYVDFLKGFYRVYDVTSNQMVRSYSDKVLNINPGDTVIWANYDEDRMTILSKQDLWGEKNGIMTTTYKQISYTFNDGGTYDVYIQQRPNLGQKIIVGPIENPVSDNISNPPDANVNNTNNTDNVTNDNNVNGTGSDNITNDINVNGTGSDNITNDINTYSTGSDNVTNISNENNVSSVTNENKLFDINKSKMMNINKKSNIITDSMNKIPKGGATLILSVVLLLLAIIIVKRTK